MRKIGMLITGINIFLCLVNTIFNMIVDIKSTHWMGWSVATMAWSVVLLKEIREYYRDGEI